jgi:hypothetical protein
MTEAALLFWIRNNLGDSIRAALELHKKIEPDLIWEESDLAAIARREVGFLLPKLIQNKTKFDVICSLMKGDYGQREGEKEKQYHGFSFWQLDVNTHLSFIKTGEWKDPIKACYRAISTLEDKKDWLLKNVNEFNGYTIHRAAIASYNCGQGNVNKALLKKRDIDYYTYNKDYSKEVLRFKELYENLPSNN